jgi:hypothetical protein
LRIIAHLRHGLKCQVPGALDGPFVILFEQQCADETDDGFVVRKDADDLGASLDFAVETLDWIRNRYKICGADVRLRFLWIVAYGVTIRDRGTGSTKVRAGRCIR